LKHLQTVAYLRPFAMWWALPISDYYGRSATIPHPGLWTLRWDIPSCEVFPQTGAGRRHPTLTG